MSKSIIMSVQPKWLVKILNGEKTEEIRKTIPKCELPVDVYLYCTKGKPYLYENWDGCCYKLTRTKIWQERANEEDYTSVEMFHLEDFGGEVNGKVVAKFTLNKVDTFDGTVGHPQLYINACVDDLYCLRTYGEVNAKKLYAYHIDNLVIFDKPKDLSEFLQFYGGEESFYELKKAPQSWQYVYVKGE